MRTAPAHRADIQGLRAIAVLLVVLAHAGVPHLAGGFVGVDVFFVLSGFLITGLLLGEARAHGRISLLDFYVRRARRILPAAALTLAVTDLAALFLLNFVRAHSAVVDSLHAAGFAANFHFAASGVDYFARGNPPSPILHFWSLSVEEQFYVVWPLVLSLALLGIRRRGRPDETRLLRVLLVLLAVSLGWSLCSTRTSPAAAYFSPLTRGWELALGAALAVGASQLEHIPAAAKALAGWLGVAAVVASAVVFSGGTPFPGAFALVPTLGTALAIAAGTGSSHARVSVGRLLSLRPMLAVGDRSYALYLWHWPVLILATDSAGHALGAGAKLGLVAAAFALSWLSYWLVENPVRLRVRSRTSTAGVVLVCAGAVLATATTALAAVERKEHHFEAGAVPLQAMGTDAYSYAQRHGALPAVVAAVRAVRDGASLPKPLGPPVGRLRNFPHPYRPPDGCILQDTGTQTVGKVCRLGDPSSTRLIVLMGDSHANMWLPPLLEMAWKDGWAVVPLVRLGCTPATWVTNERRCRDWYRWALGVATSLHPTVTVLGGSIDEKPSAYTRKAMESLLDTARRLKAGGPVIVIGDPEGQSTDPADCLLSPHATMGRCATTWPAVTLALYDEIARRTAQLGVRFLPTRQFVCFEHTCPMVIGHTIAWMDETHLTVAYSTQIAAPFREAFLDTFRG